MMEQVLLLFSGNIECLGILTSDIAGTTNDWGISLMNNHIGFGLGAPGGDVTTIDSSTSLNDGGIFP